MNAKILIVAAGLTLSGFGCAPMMVAHRPAPYGWRVEIDRDGIYAGGGQRDYVVNLGYSDGYRQGRDAGGDRHRYDPWRERRYRSGDHGYNRDFRMSRDEYRNLYRRGYLQGYEAGYRDAGRRWTPEP
jgi:hypothetical protein